MIDRLRYFLGVYCVILIPLGLLFWFVIHAWARWWRRLGPTRTYLVMLPALLACGVLLFRVRVWLLGRDLGTDWVLIGVAIACTCVTLALEPRFWTELRIRTLVGIPEVSAAEHRRGELLRDGLYGIVRHPRYVSSGIGMAGSALFVNHLGLYVLALLTVPAGLILVAYEERELVGRFGEAYRRYQHEVPRFVPRCRRGKG